MCVRSHALLQAELDECRKQIQQQIAGMCDAVCLSLAWLSWLGLAGLAWLGLSDASHTLQPNSNTQTDKTPIMPIYRKSWKTRKLNLEPRKLIIESGGRH